MSDNHLGQIFYYILCLESNTHSSVQGVRSKFVLVYVCWSTDWFRYCYQEVVSLSTDEVLRL